MVLKKVVRILKPESKQPLNIPVTRNATAVQATIVMAPITGLIITSKANSTVSTPAATSHQE